MSGTARSHAASSYRSSSRAYLAPRRQGSTRPRRRTCRSSVLAKRRRGHCFLRHGRWWLDAGV
eukprot:9611673-Prorocentrum_lima.AAC.1